MFTIHSRKKKLILNTFFSILKQALLLVSGFILPRLIITAYGSATNGLVNSITQFLGFITLAEFGVGAVVQSSFYRPLAEKDNEGISRIFVSSERFFNKLGIVLGIYTLILLVIYPLLVNKDFDFLFTALLIIAISINLLSQYFFGVTCRLLLNSDQYGFIQLIISCVCIVASTVVSVVMIKSNCSIQAVKFAGSFIQISQPFLLMIIVKKKYRINKKVEITEEPIKQKWNGVAQHVSATVLTNTDAIVLTIFSTLENVSIYGVYHLVVAGIQGFVQSMTGGVQSLLGNLYASDDRKKLLSTFHIFESLMHYITVLLFGATAVLIIPFVRVYTSGVNDAEYVVPAFAILITLAQASYNLRLPYNIMVLSAGHFKETQMSAILEAFINVIVSIVMVFNFGLIGVAIGTLAAMLFRTIYLSWYCYKKLLATSPLPLFKNIILDILEIGLVVVIGIFLKASVSTYLDWFIFALEVFGIIFVTTFVIQLIGNFSLIKKGIKLLLKR